MKKEKIDFFQELQLSFEVYLMTNIFVRKKEEKVMYRVGQIYQVCFHTFFNPLFVSIFQNLLVDF